jgi:hypothetical protein
MPDLTLPNGKILRNVDKSITKKQAAIFAIKQGLATIDDFKDYGFTSESLGVGPAPAKRAEAMTATQKYDEETLRDAPDIPQAEDPVKARVPFAQPPPQQVGGEGALEALGEYAPTIKKVLSSEQASPSLDGQRPSQLPEVDLQSALRPKALGSETTQQVPKPIQTELLPEEKRKEYNYYETNYASIDERGLQEKKKDQQIKLREFNGAKLGLEADIKQFEQGLANLELQKQRLQSAQNLDPVTYQQLASEYNLNASDLSEMQKSLKAEQAFINSIGQQIDQDENMINLRDYEIKSKKGGFLGATWNNILSNVGTSVSGLNTPILNALIAIDPPKTRQGETQEQANNRVRKSIREDLRGAPEEMVGDEGTTKEYVSEMQKDFLSGAWLSATGTLPLAYMGPAGIGLMASASDNVMQEMEGPEFEDIPEWKKSVFASTVGVVVGQLEKFGIQQAIGGGALARQIVSNALRKLPQGATNQTLRSILLAETNSAAINAASRIGGAMTSEAATEFQQGLIEPALKEIFNAAEEKNLLDVNRDGKRGFQTPATFSDYVSEAFHQAAQGAIGGAIFGTPKAVLTLIKESKVGRTANNVQFEMTEELLRDPEFEANLSEQLKKQVESAKITETQAKETIAAWKEAQSISAKIPSDIRTEARREAFDLLTEKEKLKKQDQSLVGDRILEIDKKLAEISKMRREEMAPSTAEWSGEDVRYKGTKDIPAPTMEWTGDQVTPKGPSKLELEAQKAEIEDKRSEEIERVNLAVAEASETGARPQLDGKDISPEQEIASINAKYDAETAALAQPTPTADAVQVGTTAQVGAQPVGPEVTGQEGGAGVGPSVQGPTAPQAGGAQGQVTITAEPTAEGPVRPEAPPTPKADTTKLMADVDALQQKMDQTSNKGVKTRYQNQINKLAPKMKEVMAKFDSTVADLEKSGKLKRRCP